MSFSTAMPMRRALLLCMASAILYFLTFLNFDLYPLIWFCFVPALWAIRGATVKRALLLGSLFGGLTNAGGYYWIVHTLEAFGNLPTALAVIGYVLLCAYQGFMLGLGLALVRHGERRLGIAPVWSLPVVLPALELVYPLLFPSYIGNSQLRFHALTQVVEITGMAGLTLVIGLVNGAMYELLEALLLRRKPYPLRLAVPAGAFLVCLVYGLVRLPQIDALTAGADSLTVGLVQTNIGAQDKAADPDQFIQRHLTMSRRMVAERPDIDLVIWPESAYNRLLPRDASVAAAWAAAGIGRPLLFGALTYDYADGRQRVFNSLLMARADGALRGIYDKIELLAFGETYPFSTSLPALERVFGTNWFTRGTALEHLHLDGTTFLPMICYEDILPALVRRLWRQAGPADVLVNVTNDSWYGDTHQPMIHLALASFRSIETRRALIRSTNTGISAVVDPAGRIVQRTGQWTPETLVAEVPVIKSGGSTPFMRVGDVTGWGCVVLTLLGILRCRSAEERKDEAAQ